MEFAIISLMERLIIISRDELRAIGDNNSDSYETQADQSLVPSSFFKVCSEIEETLNENATPKDLAQILFGFSFDSDEEAETAIVYAQAISLIKDAKSEAPSADDEEIDFAIGWATLRENERGEEVEVAKQKVEDHFADPRNVLNFSYLEQSLGTPVA